MFQNQTRHGCFYITVSLKETDSLQFLGFTQPPRKKSKKPKDHMIDSMATVLQTMETTFREQEALRVQEQREYEERLRKEAKMSKRRKGQA